MKNIVRIAILALSAAALYAQTEKAQLSGTITDKSNASIPGAAIAITNSATGIKRTAETNDGGRYVVPFLDPGTYELVIRKVGNTLGNFGGAQRPNWNGENPAASGPLTSRLNDYFNTDAFTSPPPYTYGNVARLVSWLRAPAFSDLDFAIDRTFPIAEPFRLQFRSEAFNLLNRTVFGMPNTSIGSAQAGVISSIVNSPRDLQFALKLLF